MKFWKRKKISDGKTPDWVESQLLPSERSNWDIYRDAIKQIGSFSLKDRAGEFLGILNGRLDRSAVEEIEHALALKGEETVLPIMDVKACINPADFHKEKESHGIHRTAYYTLAREYHPSFFLDDLEVSVGERFDRDGGYRAGFLRLWSACPTCGDKVASRPIFGLGSLGWMIENFEHDRVLHECPVITEALRLAANRTHFNRTLRGFGLELSD